MATPELELTADPVTAPVQELITFYATELEGVAFPDVDAAGLAELAERVRTRAQDLARARQVLEEVLFGLEEAKEELEERSKQAFAYAKVYAAGRDELDERVQALAMATVSANGRKKARASEAKKNTPAKSRRRRGQADSSRRVAGPALPLDGADASKLAEAAPNDGEEAKAA